MKQSWVLWAARCIVVLALGAGWCSANELQYGTIHFERSEGNAVRFFINMQWRRTDAFGGSSDDDHKAKTGDLVDVMGAPGAKSGPLVFATGDGREYRVTMTVTDYSASPVDEYVYGVSKIIHAYMTESNGGKPWVAVLRGCCRQTDGSEFRLTTYVDLVAAPQSLSLKSLPVIVVPANRSTRVHLPANSVLGAPGRYWRMAQGAELGGLPAPSPNLVFFKDTDYLNGTMTVNAVCGTTLASCPTALAPGAEMAVSVMAAGWVGKTFSPVEFRIKVLSQQEWEKRPIFHGPVVSGRTLEGVAGYEIFLTLNAMSSDTLSCLQAIRVLNMPQGGVVSSLVSASSCVVNRSLDFRWTPSEQEVGTHNLCYDAIDDARRQSTQHCVSIVVNSPLIDGGAQFVSPQENELIELTMRQDARIMIVAQSTNPYEVMAIEAASTEELEKYGMTMSPTQNVLGRVRATDNAASARVEAEFRWWVHTSHGGLKTNVCWNLLSYPDPSRPAAAPIKRCVTLSVARCKYIAGGEGDVKKIASICGEDDMKKIASMFKVDWLTLWGLNTHLPSLQTPNGTEIKVGRLYRVLQGDTLLSVATDFQTTVSSIRSLNYDLSAPRAAAALPPATSICIFPNTCP